MRFRRLTTKFNVSSFHSSRFASIVKPQSFYDSHANSDTRCYFYNVDLQGRLFLEETLPKNIATSIKNAKFLDFFFRRLQRARPQDEQLMVDRDIPVIDYPFVSPCGKELNFIRPAVTPVVFHALSRVETTRTEELVYAGTKSQPFDEQHLAISQETGRLYHRLLSKGTLYGDYGLIRSSVAVELSERIEACDEEDIGSVSGFGILTESSGVLAIPWLPQDAEPGLWSMPFSDDTVES